VISDVLAHKRRQGLVPPPASGGGGGPTVTGANGWAVRAFHGPPRVATELETSGWAPNTQVKARSFEPINQRLCYLQFTAVVVLLNR
ncbi:unnamed protein product, partial [Heterosigma akashiwo]